MASATKRKVVNSSTARKRASKVPLALRRPVDVFLAIDFKNTESILENIPLVDGKGVTKKVPTHFLGHDTTFEEVLWKINEFRNADQDDQNNEWRRWNSMKRREKDLYRGRVCHLTALQEKMRAEENINALPPKQQPSSTTSTITPANSTSNLPSTSFRTTAAVSLSIENNSTVSVGGAMITPASGLGTPGGSTAAARSSRSQGAAEEEATILDTEPAEPATTTTRETTTQSSVAVSATGSETGATMEPPEPLGDVTKKYVGLSSSKEERMNVMPPNSRRNSVKEASVRRHKKGLPSSSVAQQGDVFSMDCVHEAIKAVATAVDTISFPGRNNYDPNHTMALFILNEVVETGTVGGGHNSKGSKRRQKPTLTLVTSSGRDMKNISQAVAAVFVDSDRERQDALYDLRVLLPIERGPEPRLVPVVEAYVNCYERSRKNPSKTPRTWDDIQKDLTEELNKENNVP